MSAVDAAFPLRGRLLPEGFPRVSSAGCERARLCPAPCPVLPAHVPHAQPSLAANWTPAGSLLVVGPLHLPSPHERQALAGFRTSSGFPPPQPWRVASRPQSRFYGLRAPSVFSGPARAGLASWASFPGPGAPCTLALFRGPVPRPQGRPAGEMRPVLPLPVPDSAPYRPACPLPGRSPRGGSYSHPTLSSLWGRSRPPAAPGGPAAPRHVLPSDRHFSGLDFLKDGPPLPIPDAGARWPSLPRSCPARLELAP